MELIPGKKLLGSSWWRALVHSRHANTKINLNCCWGWGWRENGCFLREGRQVLEGLCPKIKCTTGWNKLGGQDRDEFDCANKVASAVERWPQRLLQDSKHLSAAVFSRNSWCFGILNQFLIACKAVSSLVTIALTGTWIVELGEVRLLSLHLLKDNRTLCSEYVTKGEKTSVQTHGGAWVSYGRNPCQRSMTDFFFFPKWRMT